MRVNVIFFILFFLFTIHCGFIDVQAQNGVTNKAFYRSNDAASVFLHTKGFGVNYQHAWRKTGFSNRIVNVDLLTAKHPKEFKINRGGQDSRGYFFGKINSVGMLRASFGWQNVLFDKDLKRGVRVSYYALFGPSFGLAKPVYVDYRANGEGRNEIVRYSI